MNIITLSVLFISLFPALVLAADLARESEIAKQIEDSLEIGTATYLETAQGQRFIAIFTRTDVPQTRGAAVILHEKDSHPNHTDVIRPLRTQLGIHGWETLSIQLPIAFPGDDETDDQALKTEAWPRIDTARQFLEQRALLNNIIIGYGFGALTAIEYLVERNAEGFQAYVGISLDGDPLNRNKGSLDALRKLKMPVLDIYGERDLNTVVLAAREKRIAAKDAQNKKYEQVEIAVANHQYEGQSDQLISRIRAWINKVASGVEISR